MATDKSVNYHFLRSALWSVISRWSMKTIGFVNTVVLARLLTPEDFGVVGMASLVVGLLYSFSELGVQTHLIREKSVDADLCNTAWTLQIIQYGLLSLLLVLLAPYAAIYFNEPRVTPIIYFFALSSFIDGFGNIGVVLFLKDLDFQKDFRFNFIKRTLVFLITIVAAFELRNYWAMVIGQVVGTLLGVVISYFAHEYRPAFSLTRYREFLRFSLAIIPMNIGMYFNNKVDVLIVGRIADTTLMGGYNMASELSSLFTRELIYPIGRGLFPNFVKLRDRPDELALAYLNSFKCIVLISLPLGIGMCAVASDFVLVVLGSQWVIILPYLKWLAIYATLECLIQLMNGRILIVTGNEVLSAMFMWIRLMVISSMAILFVVMWGLNALAPTLLLATLILFPLSIFVLSRAIRIKFIDIFVIFISPLFASLMMMLSITEIPFSYFINQPIVRLFSEIASGALVYLIIIYLVWFISGRPNGIEGNMLLFIVNKFNRSTRV